MKTPLGSINLSASKNNDIQFELTVIKKDGEINTKEEEAKYIYPHNIIKASVDLKDVLQIQQKLLDKGLDASKLPNKFSKLNGIYEFFDTKDLLQFKRNDDEFQKIISDYKVEAYGYFTYSTAVWDTLNDSKAKLRKGFRVLRGGLQLANNNMIQGELITIPLTSNIGYQNQSHVIVHFTNADPDLGRKGFDPEWKSAAEDIAVGIVNRLKKWRKILKSDTGGKADIGGEIELHDWIRKQEKHEEESPLLLKNKNFFVPINEISIVSTPQSEQDAIVLFNQLIAGGVIRGIKLLATSQIKQYDGVFRFEIKKPIVNHEFDKEKNPLGVSELNSDEELTSPPKILEYKYNLDGLMREFESGDKKEKDIHLAIAWEIGNEWRKNYEITSLLDLDNLHQRDFHGITHIFSSRNTDFYAIGLKELIDYLNDVDGVQDYQKRTYSEDII